MLITALTYLVETTAGADRLEPNKLDRVKQEVMVN